MEGFSLRDMMFIVVNNSALSFDSCGCESNNCRHNKFIAFSSPVSIALEFFSSIHNIYFFFNLQQKWSSNVTTKLSTAPSMHVEEWIGTAYVVTYVTREVVTFGFHYYSKFIEPSPVKIIVASVISF